jgi:hypothetical protein
MSSASLAPCRRIQSQTRGRDCLTVRRLIYLLQVILDFLRNIEEVFLGDPEVDRYARRLHINKQPVKPPPPPGMEGSE